MIDFEDATIVVTGGASGIGLAMARAFRSRGARIVLIDIEAATLEAARCELLEEDDQPPLLALQCDVSVRSEVLAAAAAVEAFGKVRLVCANAGVSGPQDRDILECTPDDWAWTLGVNLTGVAHTIEAFLPSMLNVSAPCHLVLTASMAGLLPLPGMAPYSASKFAVVGLAETLAAELLDSNVGVSVLCPGYVVSRIHESARNRPETISVPLSSVTSHDLSDRVLTGASPDDVAEHLIQAIARRDFYVFTDPTMRNFVEKRYRQIGAAFEAAEQSVALGRATNVDLRSI